VLVGLPSDAPPYAEKRDAWNAYVHQFISSLGERTRGRMLVLFTNQEELRRFGEELSGFFSARRIPFWYQGMRGVAKEELANLFRERADSILMGVDTFWYGADFPGRTLEYLVIVKLPYGVPDRYHHAQCAALGSGMQRRRIYLPRALAKFRQGFGRLMRRETDRGCVFVLDSRAQMPQHRLFLEELPLAGSLEEGGDGTWRSEGARVVRASTEECVHAALAHMAILGEVRTTDIDSGVNG
jgi:ATP-dependent DNA helicase DinG